MCDHKDEEKIDLEPDQAERDFIPDTGSGIFDHDQKYMKRELGEAVPQQTPIARSIKPQSKEEREFLETIKKNASKIRADIEDPDLICDGTFTSASMDDDDSPDQSREEILAMIAKLQLKIDEARDAFLKRWAMVRPKVYGYIAACEDPTSDKNKPYILELLDIIRKLDRGELTLSLENLEALEAKLDSYWSN